jgi:hypothetical protein
MSKQGSAISRLTAVFIKLISNPYHIARVGNDSKRTSNRCKVKNLLFACGETSATGCSCHFCEVKFIICCDVMIQFIGERSRKNAKALRI